MLKWPFSIRFSIIMSFNLLLFATCSIILCFLYYSWQTSAQRLADDLHNSRNDAIWNRLEHYLNGPININEANHALIENGIVDIHNKKSRDIYFASIIKAAGDDLYSFSYGAETGEYYGARRNAAEEIEIMENNDETNGRTRYYAVEADLSPGRLVQETAKFDARARDWYRIAKQTRHPSFSPVYKHFVMEDLAVSAAYPIMDKQGAFKGVLGAHITLSKINSFLKELVKGKLFTAYVVERDSGFLVANSLKTPNFQYGADNAMKRKSLAELGDNAITQAYQEYRKSAKSNLTINTENDRLYVKITEYTQPGLEWLIITAVPESSFADGILKSLRFSVYMSVVWILLAILIYMKITDVIFKPVYDLIGVTEKFSRGDFFQRAQIFRDDEIGRLSGAFNKMAEQLYGLIHTLEEKIQERTRELEKTVYQLKNSEDDIRLLLDSAAEGIYGIDTGGKCTFVNRSCLKLLRYGMPEELLGKNVQFLTHAKGADEAPILLRDCQISKTLMTGECVHEDGQVFRRSDGTCFPVEYFSRPQYRDGAVVGAVITFLDTTERKKAEDRILYLSYCDQLTGLYNRRFFEDEMKRLDALENLPLTIVMADVNGLKLINDSLGHAVGDELLRKTGAVITKCCRPSDIIARLGGDEFVVVLPKTDSLAAEQMIARIKSTAADEKAGSVAISVSLGHGTKTGMTEFIQDIFKTAEDRMYKNKLVESPCMRRNALNTIVMTLHNRYEQEAVHSRLVAELCRRMGMTLGLNGQGVEELSILGEIHDIGKIAIPEDILGKPGGLTDGEWEEMKRHPEVGYRLLNTVNDMKELAPYVLAHHERWDGRGYPKGIKETEIPFQARILSIADAYAAMISDRNYRCALSPAQAIEELLKNAGSQFDPNLVSIIVEALANFHDGKNGKLPEGS